MNCSAIIVAGGRGQRMGSKINKQFLEIENKPIVVHTLEKFNSCSLIDNIILVVPEDWLFYVAENIIDKYEIDKVIKVVAGGANRQESVQAGLKSLEDNTDFVVIHDAVRPFIDHDLLRDVIQKAIDNGAAICAVPAKDTIKEVERGRVSATKDRDRMWLVQTPQVFEKQLIIKAYENALAQNISATDDSGLVEKLGIRVSVVQGSYYNIKITTPEDLEIAGFIHSKLNKKK